VGPGHGLSPQREEIGRQSITRRVGSSSELQ
jgi:hypothetical protein